MADAVFPVAETFLSINGEGPAAGQLAFFIRFSGCNLRCSYCDTRWACEDPPVAALTAGALRDLALESGAVNVTLTGGEPLLQRDLPRLLELLGSVLRIEIETNGSVSLAPFLQGPWRPCFTMDYKLPGSGMEAHMCLENLPLLGPEDVVKFVCGSREDLLRAAEVAAEYDLCRRTRVYFSPVFGKLDPAEMVEFMKERRLSRVTLQLQLHKLIWDPNKRGV